LNILNRQNILKDVQKGISIDSIVNEIYHTIKIKIFTHKVTKQKMYVTYVRAGNVMTLFQHTPKKFELEVKKHIKNNLLKQKFVIVGDKGYELSVTDVFDREQVGGYIWNTDNNRILKTMSIRVFSSSNVLNQHLIKTVFVKKFWGSKEN